MSSNVTKILSRAACATAMAASLLSGAHAAPVSFELTNLAFVLGNGSSAYGDGPNALGVEFVATSGTLKFKSELGQEVSPFSMGRIRFNDSEPSKVTGKGKDKGKEVDGPAWITQAEMKPLGVSAKFTLKLPEITREFTVTSTVHVVEGDITDTDDDYGITWDPFSFNENGLSFKLLLAEQRFNNNSTNFVEQYARFTLQSLPVVPAPVPDTPDTGTPNTGTTGTGTPETGAPETGTPGTGLPVNDGGTATPSTPPNAVPEPDTLALAGLAFGMALLTSRRRRQG